MVKIKRISRKPLKKPDAVTSATRRFIIFVGAHRKKWILGGTGIVIVLVALSLLHGWESRQEQKASLQFERAMQLYQGVSSPYKGAALAETKEALAKLEEIFTRFPRTSSGKLSLLFQGNLHLNLGEFDEATRAYEDFLKKSGDESLYRLVGLEGLGYAYEGQKDYEKAIEAYQEILAMKGNLGSKEAHLHMGRCFEKLGKIGEALEHYRAFLKGSGTSLMSDFVLREVSLLER